MMKMPLSLLLVCLVGISLPFARPLADGLTESERDIVRYIDQNEKPARDLLEKIVNINSGTMNFAGVKAVADIFNKEFKALGFETRWVDGKDFNRAGHLYASFGSSGPKLLLIGHLDTVFAKDSGFQRYTPLNDNRVRGPGITDMKGGDVVMLYALKALQAVGLLERISLRILLMGDEEKRGQPLSLATKELIEAGQWADVAIGFEDGDGNPATAVISRRGAIGWKLKVSGKAAHSSQVFQPQVGDGAIYEAARILTQFYKELASEENLTFNPGIIVGGSEAELDAALATGSAFGKDNVVAKIALVSGDIRAFSPEQLTRARSKMQSIVKHNLNHTSAELVFEDGYPPMAPSLGNRKLLAMYSKASEDLGYGKVEAVNPRNAGAADISFVASQLKMAIDGLGLMGWHGHTDDETADMNTLTQQTQRAAILMSRLID